MLQISLLWWQPQATGGPWAAGGGCRDWEPHLGTTGFTATPPGLPEPASLPWAASAAPTGGPRGNLPEGSACSTVLPPGPQDGRWEPPAGDTRHAAQALRL